MELTSAMETEYIHGGTSKGQGSVRTVPLIFILSSELRNVI
ncbi:hypothetical protein ACNRWW_01420 [Metabacillus sp. HB246100]